MLGVWSRETWSWGSGAWAVGGDLGAGRTSGSNPPRPVAVVEFWATWCTPCREAARELDEIAQQYPNEVYIVGIASQEENPDPFAAIPIVEKALSSGEFRMTYSVAVDTGEHILQKKWMIAAGVDEIPCAFVVGRDGLISWIGDPDDLKEPVAAAVHGLSLAEYRRQNRVAMLRAASGKRRIVSSIVRAICRGDFPLANRLTRAAIAGNYLWGVDLASAVEGPLVLKYPQAAEYYAEIFADNIFPLEHSYPTWAAWVLAREGSPVPRFHPDIAVRLAERAAAAPPTDSLTFEVLGLAYARDRRFSDAIRAFHECLAHSPDGSAAFRDRILRRISWTRGLMAATDAHASRVFRGRKKA